MRRKDRAINDHSEIEAILGSSLICHLAMADGAEPYVVPLSFAYADGSLYFHCASQGRKLDILRKNPRVCFNILISTGDAVKAGDQPCDWGIAFRSVTGSGNAVFVEDAGEKKKALQAIVQRFDSRDLPFNGHDFSVTTVLRVDIEQMEGKAANQ